MVPKYRANTKPNLQRRFGYAFLSFYWAGMVGAVDEISAFRPKRPWFDPGSADI